MDFQEEIFGVRWLRIHRQQYIDTFKKGANIIVVDNLESKAGGNLYNLKQIEKDIQVHRTNILNFDLLSDYIADADVIINCAASTSHSRSMNEPFDLTLI